MPAARAAAGSSGRMWFSVVGRAEPTVSFPRVLGCGCCRLSPLPGDAAEPAAHALAHGAAPSPVITRPDVRCFCSNAAGSLRVIKTEASVCVSCTAERKHIESCRSHAGKIA